MARLYGLILAAIILMAIFLLSCKTVGLPTCKNSVMLPVVFQKDSATFYTLQVPFCDTVLITPKTKKK